MIDLFDQSIDLLADTAAHDQRDVRIELGVLEPQGGADRERGSHDELQAQTDGGKNPRRRETVGSGMSDRIQLHVPS